MSYVIVDKNARFYTDSSCQSRRTIGQVCGEESPMLRITRQRDGMYHLSGKYGDIGWVDSSAIIQFL